jgi:primosomal protein N' (replication factor Y)
LAGRAGRGGTGRVLVQTIAPDARAIVHAARHDSHGFLAGELQRRQALNYPPFSHLIRIVCSAVDPNDAQLAAGAVRDALAHSLSRVHGDARANPVAGGGPVGGANPVVLGPATLFRLRGRERRVLVVKAPERRRAVQAVGEAVSSVANTRAHPQVSFSVDVDPQ